MLRRLVPVIICLIIGVRIIDGRTVGQTEEFEIKTGSNSRDDRSIVPVESVSSSPKNATVPSTPTTLSTTLRSSSPTTSLTTTSASTSNLPVSTTPSVSSDKTTPTLYPNTTSSGSQSSTSVTTGKTSPTTKTTTELISSTTQSTTTTVRTSSKPTPTSTTTYSSIRPTQRATTMFLWPSSTEDEHTSEAPGNVSSSVATPGNVSSSVATTTLAPSTTANGGFGSTTLTPGQAAAVILTVSGLLAIFLALIYYCKKRRHSFIPCCSRNACSCCFATRHRKLSNVSNSALTSDAVPIDMAEPKQDSELYSIEERDGGDDGPPSSRAAIQRRDTADTLDDDYFYDEIFEQSAFSDLTTKHANTHLTIEDDEDELPDLVFKPSSRRY